eukprot:TRINITY_DN478_c0_g1_i8.p1 TRINITY_DN478_c0_g1~~TRINITY_DN478_c0_g1_i8.p1  ORF type:complete len:278 (-),score=57.00 TRINITY_DN478_c0_g1_i8:114-947(-)
MFERLGEIYTNKEVYLTDLDHDEVPALFWWFPNQDDFNPPPPADETSIEKMERISSTIKQSRTEITEIMYSGINAEDKIIRAMEIKQEADILLKLFKECEADPECKKGEAAELFSKCKSGIADYTTNVKTMDPLKFANDMKNESEFTNGLQVQLIPWIDNAEKITTDPLEKPTSFEHAQQVEKNCVAFAKDVRKANKMLAKVDELVKALVNNKTTAEQQIEEQRTRFKKIASIAATRVESMRDLLIRWQEVNTSAEKDGMDFQPLTMFLKCYAVYFQ